MNIKSFLSSVESKSYRTFYKDGLMDMFFGLLLIGAGLNVLHLRMGMDTSPLITIMVILLIPAFIFSRIFITRPRLGYLIDYNRFYLIGFAAGSGLCLSDISENTTTAIFFTDSLRTVFICPVPQGISKTSYYTRL